jgi:hypothetical protein
VAQFTGDGDRELVVNCEQHGPMRHRVITRQWICAGFDGEGCDTVITDESVAFLRAVGPKSPPSAAASQ